ncbi:Serine/threonine-protein kinase PK-1 [Legionella rubrilucens]|uniref:Serine/threonine-protein kinase PK-1 n=1 Tax=Legionella rubrilucens TaxID=458 RepID=A0A0W0XVF9_9GAMM|nr:protein kinase [Legionella rubrilucens]KTD48613.1 Serine/threonine-protein kinase PK-1 [Legionella rubrilucens]
MPNTQQNLNEAIHAFSKENEASAPIEVSGGNKGKETNQMPADKSEKTDGEDELIDCSTEYKPETKTKIGMGAFSVVYKIQHTEANRWIAIKKIDDESVVNEVQVLKELTRQKNKTPLAGNYIIDLVGKLTLKKQVYLAMEYAPKGNLDAFFKNHKQIPVTSWEAYWKISYPIVVQCIKGMQFLHNAGYAHWDIKPQNILLMSTFEPKFCDFGLTKAIGSQVEQVGSPSYCAPELLEFLQKESLKENRVEGQEKPLTHSLKVTRAGDYFAFGITFWELAARKEAPENDLTELVENRVNKAARYGIPESCPVKVATVIQSLWHQDPTKRRLPDTMELEEVSITPSL